MGSETPKQYLTLANKPVITHTLERLSTIRGVRSILVGISARDQYWPSVQENIVPLAKVEIEAYTGGSERADTVLNGLNILADRAAVNDWVLVHDAARPCVRRGDIARLFSSIKDGAGGLLAMPVADTVKRSDKAGYITATVPRDDLWRALTPQVFRYGMLRDALRSALDSGIAVTDEASAMEHAGARPLLVKGHGDNIKITHPEDLKMAELFLSMQEQCT